MTDSDFSTSVSQVSGGKCEPHPRRCILATRLRPSCTTVTASRPRWSVTERREAPRSWATPRERMLPLARASGAARATDKFACANRLLRARCASRRSTRLCPLLIWQWPPTESLEAKRRIFVSNLETKVNAKVTCPRDRHGRTFPRPSRQIRHCVGRRIEIAGTSPAMTPLN
jgi:hypothetical protein